MQTVFSPQNITICVPSVDHNVIGRKIYILDGCHIVIFLSTDYPDHVYINFKRSTHHNKCIPISR